MVSRSWPNTGWAYLVANGLPVRPWVTTMPRSKRPEQTRRNAMRSRCDGSMLACTLNTKPENGRVERAGLAVDVERGASAAGTRSTTRVEQLAHAEVGEGRAEEHRRRLAGEERLDVEVGADAVEQVELVLRRSAQAVALLGGGPVGVDELLGRHRWRRGPCG